MRKLYDVDFYEWTQKTAEQLRRGEFPSVDIPALAEEVEEMGKRERRAVKNRLAVLIGHLLKWDHQPLKRSQSWAATIEVQRIRLMDLLDDSPSLRPFLADELEKAYLQAVLLAMKQTGFNRNTFPEKCPYSIEEILKEKDIGRL